MFNKILVVTDPEVSLTDYAALARIISDRVDPVTDIHFFHGPVDILDHSSSQYAYGSKMGIDATRPGTGSVSAGRSPEFQGLWEIQVEEIQTAYPEIKAMRTDLLSQGISVLIISVKKSKKMHIHEIAKELLINEWVKKVKFMLFVDDLADLGSLSQLVWFTANNVDPVRDCFFIDREPGRKIPTLCIDGTRKTRELDDFQRDWPNVIVMDDQTIRSVDEKWPDLGLGPFMASPSYIYKSLVIRTGAVS
jgi:4-hydroxy-3-polyprenylbenzoate decarboxylase